MKDQLIEKARKSLENAYTPYSLYKVGAAIEGASGKVYAGCNIENASYGLTMCAERVAIFKGVSEGEKSFKRIVIVSSVENPPLPCGACLQVMSEFCDENFEVYIGKDNGEIERFLLKELFPKPFILGR
ncbi:MAG: cytidine deaminase [bacterium]